MRPALVGSKSSLAPTEPHSPPSPLEGEGGGGGYSFPSADLPPSRLARGARKPTSPSRGEVFRASRKARASIFAVITAMVALPSPASADLRLCNRTSYILDLALGLEDKGSAATRGWFRIEPGQCRIVLQGAVEAEHLYVHARAPSLYGSSPPAQTAHAELCVADGNFVIAGARACVARKGQRLVAFTAIQPAQTEQGLTAHVAEQSEYSDEQARLAGIQRLLVAAGYDANPIDGTPGKKTDAALARFLKDRGLSAEASTQAGFFDMLLGAVQQSAGTKFSWCNETGYTVMAALGIEDGGAVVTRGWYRVEPGKCVKPEISGQPQRLYSFGEAVDKQGRLVTHGGQSLVWGGSTTLCTRDVRFELNDQMDCLGRGLATTGFAAIEGTGTIVRFQEP
jgi:uncharacterized membrane protein